MTHVDREAQIFGKPILQYDNILIKNANEIIVALGKKARGEVIKNLADYKGKAIVIDSSVLDAYGGQKMYYEDCLEDVREYINKSDYDIRGLRENLENYVERGMRGHAGGKGKKMRLIW